MANSTNKAILEDGPRNAVVKLSGVLDASDVVLAPAVSLSDFTPYVSTFGSLVGLRVLSVEYSAGPNLIAILEWNSSSPQQIFAVAQSEDVNFEKSGGLVPNRLITGYDGSINFRSRGYVPGAVEAFTLLIRFAKMYGG